MLTSLTSLTSLTLLTLSDKSAFCPPLASARLLSDGSAAGALVPTLVIQRRDQTMLLPVRCPRLEVLFRMRLRQLLATSPKEGL